MNSQTAQLDDLRLVALPSAVKCTELFVRFSLTEWSLRELFEEASTVASQLVSAVVERTDPSAPGFVTVRLRLSGNCLVVEIEDDQLAHVHDDAPVVDGYATGAVPLEGRGKLVWCEVPLPSGVTAAQVRLPRRDERRTQTVPEPAPGEATGPDPGIVDRILMSLQNRDW
ncbi:ATP-binding protein [Saccharomonospora xinjiangensis]|uniref:ATP-binding protein n=1 Tax=Saccharomonospora xinjiangensis TaxID=75294 RepID=UPI00351022C7